VTPLGDLVIYIGVPALVALGALSAHRFWTWRHRNDQEWVSRFARGLFHSS